MQTLYEFFSPDPQQVTRALDQWARHETSVGPQIVGKAISEELAALLDTSLVAIMLNAWSKYALIRKSLASGETTLVPLLTHTIESTHEPSIDLTRASVVVKKVQFKVTLEIEVESLVLKLAQGRIQQIEAGNFTASGALGCEGVTIAEKKSKPLNFPASYRFD